MRKSLFCLVALIFVLPVSADDLLPNNLPAGWKAVVAHDAKIDGDDLRREIRVNTKNGDFLIALRQEGDKDHSDGSDWSMPATDLARSSLQQWWAANGGSDISSLRLSNSELSSIRTTHTLGKVERGETTKRQIVLNTFVLETNDGNMMANCLSFIQDGDTFVFQHVSPRPITDKIIARLALRAMHSAKPREPAQ